MNLKSFLFGASSLALIASTQAATRYVGNNLDGDLTTIIDLSTSPVGTYGGSYDSATKTWTWSASDTYVLEDIVFITNGTLVIEAGSIVRGQPRTDAGTYDPGALVIAAGAKLIADGGNSTNPIIFTTASTTGAATGGRASGANPTFWDSAPKTAPQSSNTAGLWGGLVLLGKGPTNVDRDAGMGSGSGATTNAVGTTLKGTVDQIIFGEGSGATGNTFSGVYTDGTTFTNLTTTATTDDRSSVEGIPAGSAQTAGVDRFGGSHESDNSGVVRFVSIRHGGANLASNNELNGLTLGGVGRGTTVEYVEIYGNTDDGVELFGGSVNLKNILIVDVQDDGLDVDVGYTGTVQFLLVVAGTLTDKLLEWDGSYEAETVNGFTIAGAVSASHTPVTNFSVYNATLIGNTGATGTGSFNSSINIRDQAAPRLVNSIFVNPANSSAAIKIDNRANVANNRDTLQNFKTGVAEFRGVTCYKSGLTAVANWITVTRVNGTDDATEAEVETAFSLSARANYFNLNPGLSSLPTAALGASSLVNPVPNSSTADVGSTDSALDDTLGNYNASVVNVFYRGAFEADVTELWTSGWTASAKKGVIVP